LEASLEQSFTQVLTTVSFGRTPAQTIWRIRLSSLQTSLCKWGSRQQIRLGARGWGAELDGCFHQGPHRPQETAHGPVGQLRIGGGVRTRSRGVTLHSARDAPDPASSLPLGAIGAPPEARRSVPDGVLVRWERASTAPPVDSGGQIIVGAGKRLRALSRSVVRQAECTRSLRTSGHRRGRQPAAPSRRRRGTQPCAPVPPPTLHSA